MEQADRHALATAIRSIIAAKLGKTTPGKKPPLHSKIDLEVLRYHVRNAVDGLKRERGMVR